MHLQYLHIFWYSFELGFIKVTALFSSTVWTYWQLHLRTSYSFTSRTILLCFFLSPSPFSLEKRFQTMPTRFVYFSLWRKNKNIRSFKRWWEHHLRTPIASQKQDENITGQSKAIARVMHGHIIPNTQTPYWSKMDPVAMYQNRSKVVDDHKTKIKMKKKKLKSCWNNAHRERHSYVVESPPKAKY